MHDIRLIRENPAAFDERLAKRGVSARSVEILALDASMRAAKQVAESTAAEANALAGQIGAAAKAGDQAKMAELKASAGALKARLPQLETQATDAARALADPLESLPNLPADDVPEGADESGNVEQKRWGQPRPFDFTPRDHVDIGAPLGLDFESAQAVSGARFAYLKGPIARLNRAIGQFMLDTHSAKFGYTEVNPPVLVRDEAMFGTTQLPKFAADAFRTEDGRWLIPTSEVSLTNLVREKILSEAELPLRFTALTPCFRSEAGAAGKDTRGLIRQHQFEKVELVSITTPDAGEAEHERMTAAAEHILEALDLPYRRMLLCAGDMGFAAIKTYDLEVWLPAQRTYREISSCSNCRDFQARRMKARYRPANKVKGVQQKGTELVHTLNGSGLAVGRTLVAVLENYQNADASVTVPPALVPYMGGLERLIP